MAEISSEDYDFWYDFEKALNRNELSKAEYFARKIEGNWIIAESFIKIARIHFIQNESAKGFNLLNEAIDFAKLDENSVSLQDSLDASSVLGEIAEEFAINNEKETAIKIAESIKSDWKKARSLENLANIFQGKLGSFQKIRINGR